MSNKNADFPVRNQRRATSRRAVRITNKYSDLSDPVFIIKSTRFKLSRILSQFNDDLKDLFDSFSPQREGLKIIDQARRDFLNDIQGFLSRGDLRLLSKQRMVNAVDAQYSVIMDNARRQIIANNRSKMMLFKSMADAERISNAEVERIADGRSIIEIDGKKYDQSRLKTNWQVLTRRFGKHDTVQFVNGNNFPLRAYTDMKTATLSRDIQNISTSIDASANGIFTVRFSSHGASDSCQLHEGEIAFIDDGARSAYLKQFPNDTRARSFRTVDQIRGDSTHMLKPNCKHTYGVFVLQFLDEKDREKEVAENKIVEIPTKINEKKLIEQTREERFGAAA